jgi:hypothetical protein
MTITADDVFAWMKLENPASAKREAMEMIVAAVEARFAASYNWTADPLLVTAALPLRDQDADLALILQAAQLSTRPGSPGGVAGVGEFGVIRVSRFDPDVDGLLSRYRKALCAASGSGHIPARIDW